jgi:hypothetical protein
VGWLLLKLHVSFDTEAGRLGMVPVLDGAVIAPTFACVGVFLLDLSSQRFALPFWALLVAWVLSVFAAGWAIILVGNLGSWYHRKQASRG